MDLHFRPKDCVKLYCGLTSPLAVNRLPNGEVKVQADKKYTTQSCAKGLFKHWGTTESDFGEVLGHYLRNVEVDSRWTSREGEVQTLWSQVTHPWTPFDREAVLKYPSKAARDAQRFPQVEEAHSELEKDPDACEWPKHRQHGRELDQLAVDPEGSLVLLELKDASASSAEVYYAPLQLLQYIWEWHAAIDAVLKGVQELLDARVELGLTSKQPRLTQVIRPVIGFGPNSGTYEVQRRYRKVLEIANQHLPPDVGSIETWAARAGVEAWEV